MKLNEIKKAKSVADLGIQYKGGNFYVGRKSLTSLKGSPQKVGGNFDCTHNNLTSLKGAPQEVGGDFKCSFSNLTSLEGAPQKIGGDFWCGYNDLTSLQGAPRDLGDSFYCYDNKLTSLKDIHRQIHRINGAFGARACPIQSHVLGLLLIKDLKKIELDSEEVAAIINSHLDGGSMRSALDCQHDLIKAGFPEYAKL